MPATRVPSDGLTMVRFGAAVSFETVTSTVDVPSLPAASSAIAVSTCAPLAVPVLSQVTANGAAVASPIMTPSTLKRTPATPTLSEAVADSSKAAVTSAPAVGAVSVTVGGVVSGTGASAGAVSVDV